MWGAHFCIPLTEMALDQPGASMRLFNKPNGDFVLMQPTSLEISRILDSRRLGGRRLRVSLSMIVIPTVFFLVERPFQPSASNDFDRLC
jgi:hypothetical protein